MNTSNYSIVNQGVEHNGLVKHEVTVLENTNRTWSISDVIALIKDDERLGRIYQKLYQRVSLDTWLVYTDLN